MNGERNHGFVDDTRTNSYSSFSAAISSTEQLTHKDKDNTYTVELRDLKKSLEAGDYDPYNFREIEHPTTNSETLLHLLKGSLGTGILAMPLAFSHSGYMLGVIATACIGLLCTYCIHMLIKCEYELCKRRKVPSMTYPATAECALQEGPVILQGLAPYSVHIVNAFLMIYQLGTCCVYTVFIGENVELVVRESFDVHINVKLVMLIFLLPLIFINYVKNLKFLAPLSTLANFITVVSFGIILYYLVESDIKFEDKSPIGNYKNYPLFFGTVLFALEAIGVIMPLENEMKTPRSFGGTVGVLNIGMGLIIILYIGMGLLGYLAYGDGVGGSISYSIGSDIPAQICKLMLTFAIFISHSLQMYVAIDISWNQYLQPRLEKNPYQTYYEYATRTFLVIFCFCVAVAVPFIDLFISLFGALSLSALGLAFPAIIDICTHWHTLRGVRGTLIIARNCFIIVFAFFGLIVGTTTSLEKIVEQFGKNPNAGSLNSTLINNNTAV